MLECCIECLIKDRNKSDGIPVHQHVRYKEEFILLNYFNVKLKCKMLKWEREKDPKQIGNYCLQFLTRGQIRRSCNFKMLLGLILNWTATIFVLSTPEILCSLEGSILGWNPMGYSFRQSVIDPFINHSWFTHQPHIKSSIISNQIHQDIGSGNIKSLF